jgi:hypothetical protein
MQNFDPRYLSILECVNSYEKDCIESMIRAGIIADRLGPSDKPCLMCKEPIDDGSAVYIDNDVIKNMVDNSEITQDLDGATVLPFCSPRCAYMLYSPDIKDMFYDTRDLYFTNQANKIWRHIPRIEMLTFLNCVKNKQQNTCNSAQLFLHLLTTNNKNYWERHVASFL